MRDPEALVVLHLYLVFLASCMHAYLYCFCVSFSRDDADGGCEISAGNIQCVCPHLTNRCICAFDPIIDSPVLKLSVDSRMSTDTAIKV